MTKFTTAQKFETTAELYSAGVKMMRQNLRRRHREWTEAQLDAAVLEWMCSPAPPPAFSSESLK